MSELAEDLSKVKKSKASSRIKLSDCVKVRKEEEIEGKFTSVIGEYYVPSEKKTGFFKTDSSFYNHSDLRELLASRLLKKMEIPCADILLAYDDTNSEEGCLSMNILGENERFLELDIFSQMDDEKFEGVYGLERFLQRDLYSYSKQHNIPTAFLEKRRIYLLENAFISAFLGNDDVKTENCKIVYNEKTGEYRNPEYYDMGMSFEGPAIDKEKDEKHQRYFFDERTDIETLNELYHKYPHEIAGISRKIAERIDREAVKKILSDEVFEELDEETRKRIWLHIGKKISLISRRNKELYGINLKKGSFATSLEDVESTIRTAKVPLIERTKNFLQRLRLKEMGDRS